MMSDVFFTRRMEDDGMMLMDVGAPSSLAGKGYLDRYLVYTGIKRKDLEVEKCKKKFRFGPGHQHRRAGLWGFKTPLYQAQAVRPSTNLTSACMGSVHLSYFPL